VVAEEEATTVEWAAQAVAADSVESHSTCNLVKLSPWLWAVVVVAVSVADQPEVVVLVVAVIPA
jgi:hypothetical protein